MPNLEAQQIEQEVTNWLDFDVITNGFALHNIQMILFEENFSSNNLITKKMVFIP